MNARSALFDLYGDHLRGRGGVAPVAAVIRLLAPVGLAAPAVRTAVSRMVRQGWLEPVPAPGAAVYGLTPRAQRRLDEAAARIYRTRDAPWDGSWHLLAVEPGADRSARERLRAGLTFLGYAQLDDGPWISPRGSAEVDPLLAGEHVRAERFLARHDGDTAGLVSRAWDLDAIGRSYLRWMDDSRSMVVAAGPDASDEECFAARFRLVHEWRKFLFTDPGLPGELLPADWPGATAAAFFDAEAGRLESAAARFVNCCIVEATGDLEGLRRDA